MANSRTDRDGNFLVERGTYGVAPAWHRRPLAIAWGCTPPSHHVRLSMRGRVLAHRTCNGALPCSRRAPR